MVYEQSDFVDDLPENCDYFDEGCNLAPSCLNCPFPFCIHDVSPDGTSPFKKWRDDEIVRRTAAGVLSFKLLKIVIKINILNSRFVPR